MGDTTKGRHHSTDLFVRKKNKPNKKSRTLSTAEMRKNLSKECSVDVNVILFSVLNDLIQDGHNIVEIVDSSLVAICDETTCTLLQTLWRR